MGDEITHQDRLRSILRSDRKAGGHDVEADDLEVSPGAPFAYLRGIQDRAHALELRLRDGRSHWFAYGLLGIWQYDPSVGLLLKFNGDVVYLVLITGSNLDMPVKDGGTTLTAGLQRHRVLWVREMTKQEIENAGEKGPTIDRIQVAALQTQAEINEWLKKNAAAFVR